MVHPEKKHTLVQRKSFVCNRVFHGYSQNIHARLLQCGLGNGRLGNGNPQLALKKDKTKVKSNGKNILFKVKVIPPTPIVGWSKNLRAGWGFTTITVVYY